MKIYKFLKDVVLTFLDHKEIKIAIHEEMIEKRVYNF